MKRFALVLFPLLSALAGCGGSGGSGKTMLTRYPRWHFEQYQRIAVLPLKSANPKATEAARQAGFELEQYLTGNGHFTILSRSEVNAILQEQDLSRLGDTADPTTTIAAGKIQAAQALVVPSLTMYEPKAVREQRTRPVYARDNRGLVVRDRRTGQPILVRQEAIDIYHHSAAVAGNVRVIDTATGQVVFSYSTPPIQREDEQAGGPPRASPDELAIDAAREMASDMYANLAPIEIAVKLKSDSLVVSLGYYDGKYDETRTIPLTENDFQVVVRSLPKECDRNEFRVVVAEPVSRRDLFEDKFIWSAGMGVRGQAFTVSTAPLRATGAAEFEAKLYSANDPTPLLTRSFKLEQPKEK